MLIRCAKDNLVHVQKPQFKKADDIKSNEKMIGNETLAQLDKQMYLFEVALNEELLEQLAFEFEKKAVLRESYPQVGLRLKKHKAFSADILAKQEWFMDLHTMSSQLQLVSYCREQEIRAREKAIMERWHQLQVMLKRTCSFISLKRDLEILSGTIMAIQKNLGTLDPGSHLLDVQETLKKFHLQQEPQVKTLIVSKNSDLDFNTR